MRGAREPRREYRERFPLARWFRAAGAADLRFVPGRFVRSLQDRASDREPIASANPRLASIRGNAMTPREAAVPAVRGARRLRRDAPEPARLELLRRGGASIRRRVPRRTAGARRYASL